MVFELKRMLSGASYPRAKRRLCSSSSWVRGGRPDQKKACFRVETELLNRLSLLKQQRCGSGIAGIADRQTDNLGRNPSGHAESEKVLVLGYQYRRVLACPLPDERVTGAAQSDRAHMGGFRKPLDQQRQEPLGQIFIQKQPLAHGADVTPRRRW